jgi:hypothetical protein
MKNGAEGRKPTRNLIVAWWMFTRPFCSTWWPWTTIYSNSKQVVLRVMDAWFLTVLIILEHLGRAGYELEKRTIFQKKKKVDDADTSVQKWVSLLSFWKDITIQVRIGFD